MIKGKNKGMHINIGACNIQCRLNWFKPPTTPQVEFWGWYPLYNLEEIYVKETYAI